jgi:hypothetical protein
VAAAAEALRRRRAVAPTAAEPPADETARLDAVAAAIVDAAEAEGRSRLVSSIAGSSINLPDMSASLQAKVAVSDEQQADPRLLGRVYDDMAAKFVEHGLNLPAVEAMRQYFTIVEGHGAWGRCGAGRCGVVWCDMPGGMACLPACFPALVSCLPAEPRATSPPALHPAGGEPEAEPLAYSAFPTPLPELAVRLGVVFFQSAHAELASLVHQAAQEVMAALPESERALALAVVRASGRGHLACFPARPWLALPGPRGTPAWAALPPPPPPSPPPPPARCCLGAGHARHLNRPSHYHVTIFMTSQPHTLRPDPFDPGAASTPAAALLAAGPAPGTLLAEVEAMRAAAASTPAPRLEVGRLLLCLLTSLLTSLLLCLMLSLLLCHVAGAPAADGRQRHATAVSDRRHRAGARRCGACCCWACCGAYCCAWPMPPARYLLLLSLLLCPPGRCRGCAHACGTRLLARRLPRAQSCTPARRAC